MLLYNFKMNYFENNTGLYPYTHISCGSYNICYSSQILMKFYKHVIYIQNCQCNLIVSDILKNKTIFL